MGANIGTTVTGWLVALLGFKVKITNFALPAVGLGFGLTFMKGAKPRQIGESILGFGLLFLGLALLKKSVPKVGSAEIQWIQQVSELGFLSTLIFVGLGTVLTVVLQSSSATMTLTLTMTAGGLIPYEAAAAMILGENIGTTATANLAAIGTTATARRAARAHFLFNIFGVIWALALLNVLLLPVVDAIVPGDPLTALKASPASGAVVVTAHLAALHTLFNVTNTLLMLPFVNQLAALVRRLVRDEKREGVTKYISTGLVETPELMLVQARKEMQHMSELVREMYSDAIRILTNPNEKLGSLVEDTLEREKRIDALEREITAVVAMTARAATSARAARELGEMVLNTHRLERIGDHCEKLVTIAVENHEADEGTLSDETIADIKTLADLVNHSLENLGKYLLGENGVEEAAQIEMRINEVRDRLRARHIDRMRDGDAPLGQGLRLLQAVHHLEEIGDRTYGIVRRAESTKRL